KGEIDGLYNIDVMLSDRFIEYLRNGTVDDLEAFEAAVLSFTDSGIGDKLKESEEGKSYFHRWNHFLDLCQLAVENYDPEFMKRLVESRKYGKELLNLLAQNPNGIRHNELSKEISISPQYLSKLLREFQEHDLVTRERKNKLSIIKLGLTGRAYMKQKESQQPYEEVAYRFTHGTSGTVAERREEYNSTSDEFLSTTYFTGPWQELEKHQAKKLKSAKKKMKNNMPIEWAKKNADITALAGISTDKPRTLETIREKAWTRD
ncbi:MAG: MarR family transcriptional regulator, partial [bacterium]|nr:MarR family transcriptional regulator [bacterium]